MNAVFKRAARTYLERELTENVLVARAAIRKNGGRQPRSVPIVTQSAIDGARWLCETSSSGVTIHLDRELKFPGLVGDPVLLRYELRQ